MSKGPTAVASAVGLALWSAGTALAAPDKADVCHRTGDGSYILINVSERALPAHLRHGDGVPGDRVPGLAGKKFAADCAIVDACPTLTAGEAAGFTTGAGFRVKGSPGPDVYLGVGDLGVGGNRVQADAGNPLADGTYPLTFAFDAAANAITLTGPASVNLTYDFDVQTAQPGCPAGNWNALVLTVRDSRSDGGVGLRNVTLGACQIGSFAPPAGDPDGPGTPGVQNWTLSQVDLGSGFTLGANLSVINLNANESLKVEARAGCLP